MNSSSILNNLLCDRESLLQYISGHKVEFNDIKRRMLALERGQNINIPDHHYRLLLEKSFENITSISTILTTGLSDLSKDLLIRRSAKIFVKECSQYEWHDLITKASPLVLQCAFIWNNSEVNWENQSEVHNFYTDEILINFKHTALPSPYIEPLLNYCIDNNGFYDLHMHLNGATEVDVAWQSYLKFPDKIYNDLAIAWENEKVRELLEQESSLFKPLTFRNILTVARRLRYLLFDITNNKKTVSLDQSLDGVLSRLGDEYSSMEGDNYAHPFANIVFQFKNDINPLAIEALMYVRIMDHISKSQSDYAAELFHFYLLILGLCNRLLVHQINQKGFEQFQKITLTGMREYIEKTYEDRFFQIRGNNLSHLSHLEGRFSPKASEQELTEMLNSIENSWNLMNASDKNSGIVGPSLRLVAHFIKKAEGKDRDKYVRHRKLRIDLWSRATVLLLLIRKYPKYRHLVTGIDAASSEFDAPPEVFAPTFRLLRNSFCHFTYHAGEDFHHLTSGMRAIYEAIFFTDMKAGDRIGHAVALGLSPNQWLKAVGNYILISQGEWLDNLIFIYHICKDDSFISSRPFYKKIIPAILAYASVLYEESYTIETLEEAWLHRKYEPMLLFAADREQAQYTSVFDESQWLEISKKIIPIEVKEIIKKYHSAYYRVVYEKIITIKSNEIFNSRDLLLFQRKLLKFMCGRDIAIEILPTSNIRIGHHRSFKTYHLWNWLNWQKLDPKSIPIIVVGTDDTGIFATNIYNEYANIYHYLSTTAKKSTVLAMDIIKSLEDHSKRLYFRSGAS